MRGFFHKLRERFSGPVRKKRAWNEIEYFDPVWQERIRKMAAFIPPGRSVLDLGCGERYLETLITAGNYYPVDYTSRGPDTIICDFNKKEFPSNYADVSFASGIIEYVKDYNWFIGKLREHSSRAVISYCTTDNFADPRNRRKNAWVNHLSEQELVNNFIRHGFRLVDKTETETRNVIFVFDSE